jgi:cytochrome c553
MNLTVHGQTHWDAPPIVTTNCSGCHGINGNTDLRYFPRLAGLNSTYAEKKLAEFNEAPPPRVDEVYSWMQRAFGERKSTGNLTHDERVNMIGVAHSTRPEDMKEALLWYARQSPEPGHGGDKALIREGQELFTKGVPDQQILPCVSCHGQNAEGEASAPRLGGQNAEYIQAQVAKFRRGDRKHAPEMTMVARDLNAEQARAVAAYLQSK